MATNKSQKVPLVFYCENCDYTTSNKFDYNKHLLTNKHLSNKNQHFNNQEIATPFICTNCSKEYTDRSGLWRHSKKCSKKEENICQVITPIMHSEDFVSKEMFMMVLQQNKEMMEIIKNGTINNNNTLINNNSNNNNNTFNLQFFLNETCKNAMNIDDFVSSIKPTFEDLEHVGKVGYAEGISNIIIKRLNEIEVSERPFHCSDLKRETLYVKTNNVWNKESQEKPLLVTAIKQIAKLNMDNILPWQKANPGCTDSDSTKNKKYLNMVLNSMDGSSNEEALKNINKIISKVSNLVHIK